MATILLLGADADQLVTDELILRERGHRVLSYAGCAPALDQILSKTDRVYIERLRTALEMAFQEAGLSIDPQAVLLKQETVMDEVGYWLRASFEWVHIDR